LGRFDFGIDADLERLAGWTGAGCMPTRMQSTAKVSRAIISPIWQPSARPKHCLAAANPAWVIRSCAIMTVLEAIYEAPHQTGLINGAIFSYVFGPSGGAANPLDPAGLAPLRNAASKSASLSKAADKE